MRTRAFSHLALPLLLALGSASVLGGTAHAADAKKDDKSDKKEPEKKDDKGGTSASASVSLGGADAKADDEAGEEKKEEEGKIELTADAVVGFGRVPALNPNLPVTLGTAFASTLDDTKVTSDSYVLGAGYWITPNLRLRARLPLAHTSYRTGGLPKNDRGSTTLGNVDLAVTYEKALSKSFKILPGLVLGLPTAPGMELPTREQVDRNPTGPYDQNSYDHFSDLRAAAAARGLDEGHLWASNRFGVVPEIEAEYESGKLSLEPFFRFDNLFSTSKTNSETWVADFVLGARLGYEVTDWMDLALKAWGSYSVKKEGRDDNVLINVEPQAEFNLGPVHPYLGLIVPVFPVAAKDSRETAEGPIYDVRYVSFRLGVFSRF